MLNEPETNFQAHLRTRVEGIANQILDHVESVIRSGSPKQKSDLIRQVFPVLVKALNPDDTNLELDSLRKLQAELLSKLHDS